MFNVAQVPAGNAYLTIPVAGGPGNVTVLVNGQEVGRVSHGDDAARNDRRQPHILSFFRNGQIYELR